MSDPGIENTLANQAGRSCPLSYRYRPEDLAALEAFPAEVLYVVGGVYGNGYALDALEALAARESAPVTLVFNGDFNWFNSEDEDFRDVNTRVLNHRSLRGNVETELAAATAGTGCGCGYPQWVDEGTVHRSNQIMLHLAETAARHPDLKQRLGALPMALCARVGGLRVLIVHGDAHSLAGWDYAPQHLTGAQAQLRLRGDFNASAARVIACTHTCIPLLRRLALSPDRGDGVLINNGAAGMPNFDAHCGGLITRIATHPAPVTALYGECLDGVHIDALALEYDHPAFVRRFLQCWPPGSAAHESYFQRISGNASDCMARVGRSDHRA